MALESLTSVRSALYRNSWLARACVRVDSFGHICGWAWAGEVKQLAETLLAPGAFSLISVCMRLNLVRRDGSSCQHALNCNLHAVDDASGTPRGFTPTELGDIMTKMDRDGNNTVDFEEFYYWYSAICKIASRMYVDAAH
eukprot:COSAG02_NODE_4641_length_5137_cov_114.825057_3_plen_140_part_00